MPRKVGEVNLTDAASLAKAITELEKQMKATAPYASRVRMDSPTWIRRDGNALKLRLS
jgi:hypothetical protein